MFDPTLENAPHRYRDRAHAGTFLAAALEPYRLTDAVVCALPRGGVPVGFTVAEALSLPLSLIFTKKVGHPTSPEVAVCVATETGEVLCDERVKRSLDPHWLEEAVATGRELMRARKERYTRTFTPPPYEGHPVILVDDGAATGLSLRAAASVARQRGATKVVAALPVAPPEVVETLTREVDELIVLTDPHHFRGVVGEHYDDFATIPDHELVQWLERSAAANGQL